MCAYGSRSVFVLSFCLLFNDSLHMCVPVHIALLARSYFVEKT